MSNITIRKRPGAAAHLFRPRPQDDGPFHRWVDDHNRFFVYVHVDVLEFIRNEARRAMPNETIGLLAGRVCEDPKTGPYTMIVAAENARSQEFEASRAHVRLRGPGQACVRRRLEDAHPDREIVGWYHTHPGYPSHFSSVDIDEQKNWSDRNHIGIVYSTTDAEEFGVYQSSDAIRLKPVETNRIPVPRPLQIQTAEPPPIPVQIRPTPPPVSDPVPVLPAPPPADELLTPRQEPLGSTNNVLTSTTAALPIRIYIVLIVMTIVFLAQMVYLFRLDRRLSFNEGRVNEVSASHSVLEKVAERLVAHPSSTPAPSTAPVVSDALETDGTELRLPAKPLKPETASRKKDALQSKRTATDSQPQATPKPNRIRRTQQAAQKPDLNKGDAKPSGSPVSSEAKPERTPQ